MAGFGSFIAEAANKAEQTVQGAVGVTDPTPEPEATQPTQTESAPQQQPGEQPQASAPPPQPTHQGIPPARLTAATNRARAFQAQAQEAQQRVKALEAELAQAVQRQAPSSPQGEDSWLQEYLEDGTKPAASATTPEMKALMDKIDKMEKWQNQQVQAAQEAQEDAALESVLPALKADCPNFSDKLILRLISTGMSPEEVVAEYASQGFSAPAPTPAPRAPKAPAPPPPPSINPPGSPAQTGAASYKDMSWKDFIKKGLPGELRSRG
jgi:hypothetical protein